MRTLPDTLVRGWTDDLPVVVRDDLVVLHDDVATMPRVDRAVEPDSLPAQRGAAKPSGMAVLVARTSTGPARRRMPVAVAARALHAFRGDHDDHREWATPARAVPSTIASVLTGQRL
jgi:hypothetical protein